MPTSIVAVCGATSLWKLAMLVAILVAYAAIGVGCLVKPDWAIKHFARALLGGGELRRDLNRVEMSFLGLVFGSLALCGIYIVLRACF